jgi:hypothetical protein
MSQSELIRMVIFFLNRKTDDALFNVYKKSRILIKNEIHNAKIETDLNNI